MDKAKLIIAFASGAAIGAGISWYLTKKEYDKIVKEEVADVQQHYDERYKILEESRKRTEKDLVTTYAEKYKKAVQALNQYADSERMARVDEELSKRAEQEPYEISETDFGEFGDYETQSVTLYYDDVLVDTLTGEVIEEPEAIIGPFTDEMSYEEDDIMYIRNDALKYDFELTYDSRTYDEATEGKPPALDWSQDE